MFGLSSVAALAICTNVERAVISYVGRADRPDARLVRIDAQLQSIRDQLRGLTATGRDVAHVEEILAHARARIEEWTA